MCDLVILELTRLAPNKGRALATADRLNAFQALPMPNSVWDRAREAQLLLAENGEHRRVPPADLLLAVTAESAGVPIVHYDRDYERIAAVTALEARWFVPAGSLAP